VILLYERVYTKIINTVLIMNCTEIKTNKERPVKLTVGSVKHGCYKQLVVKNALRQYLRQVIVGWRFLKCYDFEKKNSILCKLLRAHTKHFSPSDLSSLQWGQEVQVTWGYWGYYQKFL